jgi:hypothetical protein
MSINTSKIQVIMKKVFGLFAVIALLLVASCGPSAKELEEKRIADSISMVAYADSVNLQFKTDSIASVKADSIRADSVAKATKKVKK